MITQTGLSEAAEPAVAPVTKLSLRRPSWWPLGLILIVQAAVSSSLIWSNTAFGDEGTYIFFGHVELNHWLHGGPIPVSAANALPFPSHFSGSPQLYMPLAALVDSVGHLAAVRLMSLAFMLVATVVLYRTASLLFGRSGAIAASIVWMTSISVLQQGAFATYDSLSICLVCVAAWAMVESIYRQRRWTWLTASGVLLALACMVAYSYAIYVPVLWLLCYLLTRTRDPSRSPEAAVLLHFAVTTSVVLVAGSALGVWSGTFHATISRGGRDLVSWTTILDSIWTFVGFVFLMALAGAILGIARATSRVEQISLGLLVVAVVLVPAYQLLIVHTNYSLPKHVACGIWLGSLAVAAGVSSFPTEGTRRGARSAAGWTVAIFLLASGWIGAFGLQQSWPNASRLVPVIQQLASHVHGSAETSLTPGTARYYSLPASGESNLVDWSNQFSLDPAAPVGNWSTYYKEELAATHPAVVILTFLGNSPDRGAAGQFLGSFSRASADPGTTRTIVLPGAAGSVVLAQVLDAEPDYRVTAVGPYDQGWGGNGKPGFFVVWQRL